MINDQMRAEFEAWATPKGFSLKRIKWNDGSCSNYVYQSTFDAWQAWQAAYQAGRKAEQETIRKLISPQVIAPLIELSERVNEEFKQNNPEGDQ